MILKLCRNVVSENKETLKNKMCRFFIIYVFKILGLALSCVSPIKFFGEKKEQIFKRRNKNMMGKQDFRKREKMT